MNGTINERVRSSGHRWVASQNSLFLHRMRHVLMSSRLNTASRNAHPPGHIQEIIHIGLKEGARTFVGDLAAVIYEVRLICDVGFATYDEAAQNTQHLPQMLLP